MEELFKTGLIVDLILGVMLIEAVGLFIFSRRFRFADVVGQFLAGAFLLCALRCALTGLSWPWTAIFLSASFPAHLFDLWRRGAISTSWR